MVVHRNYLKDGLATFAKERKGYGDAVAAAAADATGPTARPPVEEEPLAPDQHKAKLKVNKDDDPGDNGGGGSSDEDDSSSSSDVSSSPNTRSKSRRRRFIKENALLLEDFFNHGTPSRQRARAR